MRRSGAAMAVALVLGGGLLAAGCFDTSPVFLPTGAECDGLTPTDADVCDGGICLGLAANKQNMAGFCSASCSSDANCTPHDHCVSFPNQGNFCLRACKVDDDCYDAFICVLPSQGAPYRVCLVDPS
jgi:hypothetical protein